MDMEAIDRFIADSGKYSLIEDHLYLANFSAATNLKMLAELNITAIISVMDSPIRPTLRSDSIAYHLIKADDIDSQDLLSYFPQTNQLIANCQAQGKNILVHCMAGISRSATIVIAFIMNKHKMSFSEAKGLVQSKRPIISPNDGFEQQLRQYEQMI